MPDRCLALRINRPAFLETDAADGSGEESVGPAPKGLDGCAGCGQAREGRACRAPSSCYPTPPEESRRSGLRGALRRRDQGTSEKRGKGGRAGKYIGVGGDEGTTETEETTAACFLLASPFPCSTGGTTSTSMAVTGSGVCNDPVAGVLLHRSWTGQFIMDLPSHN